MNNLAVQLREYARSQNLSTVFSVPTSYFGGVNLKISHFCHSLFVPAEQPTWREAILKTSTGLAAAAFLDLQSVPDDRFSNCCQAAGDLLSVAVLITGLREMCYLGFKKLTNVNVRKTNRIKNLQNSQKDLKLQKLIKTTKLITTAAMSLYCLYNYDYLGNVHIYSKSLYFREALTTELASSITFSSLQACQIATCAIAAFTNLKQLMGIKSQSYLKSSPMDEIIQAFVVAIFFSQMNAISTQDQQLYHCFLSNLDRCEKDSDCIYTSTIDCVKSMPFNQDTFKYVQDSIERFILYIEKQRYLLSKSIGYHNPNDVYMVFGWDTALFDSLQRVIKNGALFIPLKNAISLMGKNIHEYRKPMLTLTTKAINTSKSINDSKVPANPRSQKPVKRQEKQKISDRVSWESPFEENNNSSYRKYKPLVHQKKKKTRGTANPQMSKPAPAISQTVSTPVSHGLSEAQRKEGLARVQVLSKQYPLTKQAVKSELKKIALLLNGKPIGKKGSRYKLVWTINQTRYSLHYEIAHDTDGFITNKRDCVLNVLNAAYLIGLNEKSVEECIKQYNLEKLYRIDKFIHYILSNRRAPTES